MVVKEGIDTRVNEKHCLPQEHTGRYSHLPPTASPEGSQDGNRMPAVKPSASAATPPGCPRKETRDGKAQDTSPREPGAGQRSDFSEPRLCTFPYRKMR